MIRQPQKGVTYQVAITDSIILVNNDQMLKIPAPFRHPCTIGGLRQYAKVLYIFFRRQSIKYTISKLLSFLRYFSHQFPAIFSAGRWLQIHISLFTFQHHNHQLSQLHFKIKQIVNK